jgi:LDH2 family malate/lactate/ureidoglycolate dehydrogenase
MLGGGSALPSAGYKGSSIAFMIEIVAGALTGGCFGLTSSGQLPWKQPEW